MRTAFTLYCDESGNTGSNYVDREQPYHVLAGWVVPTPCSKAVRELVPLPSSDTGAVELKSSRLLRTSRGRARIAEVLDGMARIGCLPVYVIAEKRYCIAAKMVETLLDPEHNDRAVWLPTWADVDRKKVAEVFYGLADTYLVQFAESYRRPSDVAFAATIDRIALALKLMGHRFLSHAISGCLDRLDELVSAESPPDTGPITGHQFNGLNLPIFAHFSRVACHCLRTAPHGSVRLVHDRTTEFGSAFSWFVQTFKGLDLSEAVMLQSGRRLSELTVRHLQGFEEGDSQAVVELQAADLLAGTLNYSCKAIQRGENIDPSLEGITGLLLSLMFVDEARPCDVLASHETTGRLLSVPLNTAARLLPSRR